MTELLLFASTFTLVFALGMQSLNVNGGHYKAAFLNSFLIGTSNLFLFKLMPDATATQIAAYLLGGPLGIITSMWTHKRTIGNREPQRNVGTFKCKTSNNCGQCSKHSP